MSCYHGVLCQGSAAYLAPGGLTLGYGGIGGHLQKPYNDRRDRSGYADKSVLTYEPFKQWGSIQEANQKRTETSAKHMYEKPNHSDSENNYKSSSQPNNPLPKDAKEIFEQARSLLKEQSVTPQKNISPSFLEELFDSFESPKIKKDTSRPIASQYTDSLKGGKAYSKETLGSIYSTNFDFTGKMRWDRGIDAPRGNFIDELLRSGSDYAQKPAQTSTGYDLTKYNPLQTQKQSTQNTFPAMPIFGQYLVQIIGGTQNARDLSDTTPNIPKTTVFLSPDQENPKFTEYFLIIPKQKAEQESAVMQDKKTEPRSEHQKLREKEVQLEQLIATAKMTNSRARGN